MKPVLSGWFVLLAAGVLCLAFPAQAATRHPKHHRKVAHRAARGHHGSRGETSIAQPPALKAAPSPAASPAKPAGKPAIDGMQSDFDRDGNTTG